MLNDSPAGGRQTKSGGGTTHLISHNPQRIPSSCLELMKAKHGEQKILTYRAINPAGAKDCGSSIRPAAKDLLNSLFSCALAGPINTQRITKLIRQVGVTLLTVEHKVGAELKQLSTSSTKRF